MQYRTCQKHFLFVLLFQIPHLFYLTSHYGAVLFGVVRAGAFFSLFIILLLPSLFKQKLNFFNLI